MSDQFVMTGVSTTDAVTHSVFFALRPDNAAATAIAALARGVCRDHGLTARPRATGRLHVSLRLVIKGATIPPQLLSSACEAAASLTFRPFRVAFDRVASFVGGPVVLLGHDGTPGLMQLHERLVDALAKVGLDPGGRAAFNPHVTLAYSPTVVVEHFVDPINWTVTDFVLIDSHVGLTRHRIVGRWRLDA